MSLLVKVAILFIIESDVSDEQRYRYDGCFVMIRNIRDNFIYYESLICMSFTKAQHILNQKTLRTHI